MPSPATTRILSFIRLPDEPCFASWHDFSRAAKILHKDWVLATAYSDQDCEAFNMPSPVVFSPCLPWQYAYSTEYALAESRSSPGRIRSSSDQPALQICSTSPADLPASARS